MLARLSPPARAALVAMLLAIGWTLIDLGADFDLSLYLRVGEVSASRDFIETDIPDTQIVSGWGHDGQANYVLSRVFPDLADADGHVDSATYRSRRIVLPLIGSLFPDGRAVLVGFWLVNLIGIGIAGWVVGALADKHGASWFAGAAVGLTPAFLASMVIHLGDGLAVGLAGLGLHFWRKDRRTGIAIVLFTVAALTRETSLLIPAAAWLLEGKGRRAVLFIPPVVVGAWILFLETAIGGRGKSAEQFKPPFVGWLDQGIATPEIVVTMIFALASLWIIARLWTFDRTWSLIAALDLAVLITVDRAVLFNLLNLARVVPWVIPLAILLVTRTSADEDGLQREGDPVVDGLVDRAPLSHV